MLNRLFKIALLTCILTGCADARPVVAVSQEPESTAWWGRLTIEPHGKTIRGIPASSVNPEWFEVTELTHQLFADLPPQLPSHWHPADPEMRYSLDDLVIDGTQVSAILVAYKTFVGSTGTAVVVMSRNTHPASVLAVEEVDNRATWAELSPLSPSSFSVWDCKQCDGWRTYTWDSTIKKFHLEPSPF
jgi:hypothetical protein